MKILNSHENQDMLTEVEKGPKMPNRKANILIFLSFFLLSVFLYKISSTSQSQVTLMQNEMSAAQSASQKLLLEKQAASYTRSYQIKKAIQAILEYRKLG